MLEVLKKVKELLLGKEKPTPKGPYGEIMWRDEAKRFNVGGKEMKEIVVWEDGTIKEVHPYIEENVRWLEEDRKIPVIDSTEGEELPPQITEPGRKIKMGEL